MTFEVRWSPEAEEQLEVTAQWWAAFRPAAPALLEEELAEATALLERMPSAGRIYRDCYRMMLLRSTGLHLYYVVEDGERIVRIVALWGARTGHGPIL
ncbi:MAG: type II toxin-antitoxin system RelE/ParE family toxin [Kofleriaceae bacterium]